MTVNEALDKIQKSIDVPGIDPVNKRKLFSLYQNIRKAPMVTTEVAALVNNLCKPN